MKKSSIAAILLMTALLALASSSAGALAQTKYKKIGDPAVSAAAPGPTTLPAGRWLVSMDSTAGPSNYLLLPNLVLKSSSARLLIDTDTTSSTIAVLDGAVTIKSRLDHHVVEVRKGTAYATSSEAASHFQLRGGLLGEQVYPLFITSKSQTSLSLINARALPDWEAGVSDAAGPTDSKESGSYPQARIISPPTVVSYDLGADLAAYITLSPLMRENYPPSGYAATEQHRIAATAEPER